MQVRELMAILEDQDPEAEVLLVTQRQWPFEYSLSGVSIRSEVEEVDDDEDGDDEAEEGAPRERGRDDGAPTDVLLVEGRQLRYGSETAWNVARR